MRKHLNMMRTEKGHKIYTTGVADINGMKSKKVSKLFTQLFHYTKKYAYFDAQWSKKTIVQNSLKPSVLKGLE